MKKRDADLYGRLEKAGFMLDFGPDGSGLFMYLRRGSGYYIDVGASELVANGSIKLKSGVAIERVNPQSVTLSDGTEMPADLIVYATGYGSMNGWLAELISPEVADHVGKVWGLGSPCSFEARPSLAHHDLDDHEQPLTSSERWRFTEGTQETCPRREP